MGEEVKQVYRIRGYHPFDLNFILATWIKGLHGGNQGYHEIDFKLFYPKYKAVIDKLFDRPSLLVQVACLKDDADVILGYSVLDENKTDAILHWVYVKEAWRKLGIASDLVPKTISLCTHMTLLGSVTKPKTMIYDPFLF